MSIDTSAVGSYNEGVKAFQSGNWSEAVKSFTNVIEQSSTSSPLRFCAVYARALGNLCAGA
jgi:outer membrane protein assembly factor BamD (BamD/ComL family)